MQTLVLSPLERLINIVEGSLADLAQPGAIDPREPLDLEIVRVQARRKALEDVLYIARGLLVERR